jgi:hypothetical protein
LFARIASEEDGGNEHYQPENDEPECDELISGAALGSRLIIRTIGQGASRPLADFSVIHGLIVGRD